MSRLWLGILAPLSLALFLVHCGGEDARLAPPLGGVGGSGDGGNGAGGSDTTDAGPDVAEPDAAPQDSGPPPVPPVCDPAAQWAASAAVAGLPSGLNATAFAVTPDELTAAWIVPKNGNGGAGKLFVADRASAGDDFGAAVQVSGVNGYLSVEGLTLSPDGLRAVFVRADKTALAEATRAQRSGAFGDPDETAFATINDAAGSMTYMLVGDPVLSQDDQTLFFSGYGSSDSATVYEAYRDMPLAPWPLATPRGYGPLKAVDGARRRPTGLSSDGRTLFIWDSLVPATAREAIRPAPADGEFTQSVELGDEHSVVPNGACDRLYFIESGELRYATKL